MASPITATLFTDPGCPFAYSFRPARARLRWRFGEQIEWRLVMIGLAEDASEYEEKGFTPAQLTVGLRDFERRWGMPFAYSLRPRVTATSPACRAVIAARLEDPALAERVLARLQVAYFTGRGMLDEPADLRRMLAELPGVDAERLVARIGSPEVREAYEAERRLARSAAGGPADAQDRTATDGERRRYTAPSVRFEARDGGHLEVGGLQPFAAYDTALANLDPTLERRPAPQDALEVLRSFPDGLTTAEVAAVLPASDLAEPDRDATLAQLAELAQRGEVVCEALGSDAVWRVSADEPRRPERRRRQARPASRQLQRA
jgi:protein-disulfide isomerase-like protein with CxxC motif